MHKNEEGGYHTQHSKDVYINRAGRCIYKHGWEKSRLSEHLLTITWLKSHLLSPCPTTTAPETSPPAPMGTSCATQSPPVALPPPVTWSTALTSALPTPASRAPLSIVAARRPAVSQTFHVLSSACQKSCYRPRISRLCSPSWSVYAGSLKCGSSRGYILGYKSRNCYSQGCGSSSFRPLGYEVCGSPSLSCGSSFCHLIHMASRSCQTSCYQATCIPDFYF